MQKTDPNYHQNWLFYNILKLGQHFFTHFFVIFGTTQLFNIFIYISKMIKDILKI